ncbi:PQQ-binding-like beta-propeller repeat protein [Streptomyces sp. NPDC006372]|uniref:PQQ-binding-like beta-propeller repeat protein n=1 Tax=Streptomyces sp. NPDC006372 TaxID=3155599 RepID=UPI0033B05AB6
MPDFPTVRRVLGDRPFAEIGRPSAVAVGKERGIAVVSGDLGPLKWAGSCTAGYGWQRFRVGVYGIDDLRCHRLVESHWPVHSVAVHPTLPLVAVGTGAYDGGYAFEGELLLIDLESGRSRSMMRTPREVLRVQWESARALRLLVARADDDECDEAHTHAYDVVVERPDWSAAPRGSVQQRELAGEWVGCERPVSGREARRTVEELAGDASWEPRRQVWDVHGLPDGRVLACLEEVLAEAWRPDGRLDWRVHDEEGGRQLVVRGAEAWVNAERRREYWTGRERGTEPPLLARLSLADGRTLGTPDLASSVTITTRQDGWLALRSTAPDREYEPRPRPVALIPPDAQAPKATAALGGFDAGNHSFPVRRSSRLLFLQGAERAPRRDKWVVALDPEGDREPRRLFPLDWQSPARHLLGGPGIELGPAENRDLVHAGSHYGSGMRLAYSAFVVRRSLTDGAVRWEFATDHPATAVDGDDDTVYVALNSGELVALDASDGTVRRRQRLRIEGVPTVPLSLHLTAPDRLLIGTVDGRVLDCSVGRTSVRGQRRLDAP